MMAKSRITYNYSIWVNSTRILFATLTLALIGCSSGLQCYSCLYERVTQSNGTTHTNGNPRCKDFSESFTSQFSTHSQPPLKSCDNETDALNFKETEMEKLAAEKKYPNIPPEYQMTCMKLGLDIITQKSNVYEVELVIRGCFAKKLPPKEPKDDDFDWGDENGTTTTTTTPRPPPPLVCAVPTGSLWAGVRDGSLVNSTPITTTTPTLTACLCDTGDGCNSVGRVGSGHQIWVLGLTLCFMSNMM